jgi:hypothetical protein
MRTTTNTRTTEELTRVLALRASQLRQADKKWLHIPLFAHVGPVVYALRYARIGEA